MAVKFYKILFIKLKNNCIILLCVSESLYAILLIYSHILKMIKNKEAKNYGRQQQF